MLFRSIRFFGSSKDFSGFAFGVNSSRVRYVWYLRAGDVGFNLLIPITLQLSVTSKQLPVNNYQEFPINQQIASVASVHQDAQSRPLPILYFLDEILKGTNSKDRHEGAKALMLQLHRTTASGFISTHDVELGDEFDNQDFVENYSFSSEVINDDLVFDYKLRSGVCHSFNESMLMRGIGIEMG